MKKFERYIKVAPFKKGKIFFATHVWMLIMAPISEFALAAVQISRRTLYLK